MPINSPECKVSPFSQPQLPLKPGVSASSASRPWGEEKGFAVLKGFSPGAFSCLLQSLALRTEQGFV